MGSIFTRQNARVEELDLTPNNAYRYPPKAGNYFASHFIMGGERFETTQPESYLFGENMDLNFLGSKPTPFPYPAPQPNEPTRTLRSLINIRKESLRFVKVPDDISENGMTADNCGGTSTIHTKYNIEFAFDADVRCSIAIHYFATEEITANGVLYTPREPSMSSETYHYKKGVNQQFSQVSHIFDPSKYSDDVLVYRVEDDVIPVLIQCVAEEGEEPRQSHMIIAIVEKNGDASYTLKPLKQKLFVDGLCYLLQEIYGIENKNSCPLKGLTDEDIEDSGSECVICMSDARDALILPCRHLCLCNSCADSLRYQANNCPICRAPFRALLQIRAVRKSTPSAVPPQVSHNAENQSSQDVPLGYEAVSLIEALNGPLQPAPLLPSFPPNAPPFLNTPETRQKQRKLERHHSSSVTSLRPADSISSGIEGLSTDRIQGSVEIPPEVVVSALISSDKNSLKSDSLSLTRGEAKRHRKGFRTSSAPEKIRLLANSVQIVNEVGTVKRKMDKDAEVAETRSLLENNLSLDETATVSCSPKISRPCSGSSPVSLSTPHSLHLGEKSSRAALGPDTSPGDEDSDYFTPEDPSTTILVDQATDTSLDAPQNTDSTSTNEFSVKTKRDSQTVKHRYNRERHIGTSDVLAITGGNIPHDTSEKNCEHSKSVETDEITEKLSFASPNKQFIAVHSENPSSIPGTPASNISNNSSGGDSYSSTSSTRLLLQHQSCETLKE